ncbi:MAG: NAD-dependent epimerase/dehydratase family protein [Vicinamibacterales bacterium]
MTRIAITGASGFIGRHLTAAIRARGDRPVPIARPYDPAGLSAAFREVDVVVHLAGVVAAVRARDFFTANVDATRVVSEAARAAKVRLVHVSSLAAAGPAPASAPRSEDDPPSPITPYGRSKLEGERIVSGTPDLQWIVLRPGVVYGGGDRAMLPLFRYAGRGVLPLAGRDAAYTFVHVSDAVRAILAAVDTVNRAAIGRAFFVGHPRPVTSREVLEAVRSAAGSSAIIMRLPLVLTRIAAAFGDVQGLITGRPAVINRWRYAELTAEGFVGRVDRLRDGLGVVAHTDLSEGLAETAAFYRREGWL